MNKTLLLVEDQDVQVFAIEKAIDRADLKCSLQGVKDGDQAVEYLAGTGRFANHSAYPLPDVILLDLTLPGRSGQQVLEWMQNQPALKHIPVVVLTSSIKPTDLQAVMNLG